MAGRTGGMRQGLVLAVILGLYRRLPLTPTTVNGSRVDGVRLVMS